MTEWQPIETAPQTGIDILLVRNGRVTVGAWNNDKYARKPRPFWWAYYGPWGKTDCRNKPPTHWMPLPEPPQ